MKPVDPFIEHLLDLLQPMGGVRARRMFGGWGVYCDELMFGLVAYDTFYIKADDKSIPEFESKGMGPFIYQKEGRKPTAMSYYQAPPDAMDNSEQLCVWGQKGLAAAQRTAAKKKKSKSD